MKQLAAILFATGFTLLTSVLAGRLLLQFLRVKLSRLEERFVAFVIGSAALSTIVFLLTAAGLAHRGIFLAAGLLIITLSVWRGAHRTNSEPPVEPLPKTWRQIFWIVYGAFGLVYLLTALLPEFSADGISYHVAYVARYLREHHFAHITSFVASYPEGTEMLFLFAFAFGRHTAASMVHFLFLMATPFGILAFGRRIGSPQVGAAAGLLFFVSPIVGKAGASAYVDVALACAIVTVFLLLEIWRQEQQTGFLIAIGICAGFSFAVKYPGGIAGIYALGAVILHVRRTRQPILRPVALVAIAAFLLAAPWLIKNWVQVQNPVLPFANEIFPNRTFSSWAEKTVAHTIEVHRGVTLAELPLESTVGGSRVAGVLGPIFLLTPIVLIALWKREARRIAVAALIFAIPYYFDSDTRFAIPALPFFSLGIAIALMRWRTLAIAAVLFQALACWPWILNRYVHPWTWRIDRVDWRAALRVKSEADFLRSYLPDYDVGLAVDKTVPAGEPVYSFSGIQQAYQSHEIINEWTSSYGMRISDMLRAAFTPSLQPTRLYRYRFSPVATSKVRLVQAGSSATNRWSISELRIFQNHVELARDPQWRVSASSNPWDAGAAFDNSAVTRWASDEPFHRGMYIQADFGRAANIDEVDALCTPDQGALAMRLEYEASPGRWQAIVESSQAEEVAPSDRLRAAAIQELKRNNLHWLLMHDLEHDRGAIDFNLYRQLWGIHVAAAVGPYKLYHLD